MNSHVILECVIIPSWPKKDLSTNSDRFWKFSCQGYQKESEDEHTLPEKENHSKTQAQLVVVSLHQIQRTFSEDGYSNTTF